MKKILTVFLFVFALFIMGCGSDSKSNETPAETKDGDSSDTGSDDDMSGGDDNTDSSDSGKTDTSDSTDSADPADSGTADSTDSGSETTDSGDSQSDTESGDTAPQIVMVECTGSEKICRNNADFIGEILTCNGTKFEKTDDCEGTSCDGDKCGECVNYTRKCINSEDVASEDFRRGSIYICKEGKWDMRYSCDNSCDYDKIDGGDCGECMNGDFKCENGNVPEDTKLFNYDGSVTTVPAGFITGFRSQCVDGKWKKLALDDPENCYFGHLQSEDDLPYARINGRDIISVYLYDSNGSSTNRKYKLAMCKDDVNCGECLYSFSYCSNTTFATCYKGEVMTQTCGYSDSNGNSGCYTANSCYRASTANYCNGTQCQNCKAICNW